MMKILMASVLVISLAFAGCAGMTDTQQRTLSGGAMGAAGGAVIGAMAGNAGLGAVIGGAAGAGGGFLYGRHKEAEQAAYQRGVQSGSQRSQ
jgi:osmotically inducible lipoprotein OsmB